MARTLLVLGNGFDLLCGLKSSFKDYLVSEFYKPYMQKIQEIDERVSHHINTFQCYSQGTLHRIDLVDSENITFWDLYFALPHLYKLGNGVDVSMWYDFEKRLNTLVNDIDIGRGLFDSIDNVKEPQDVYNKNEEYKYKLVLKLSLLSKCEGQPIRECTQSLLKGILFSELKKYEERFGHYIREQQESVKNYSAVARVLLDRLVDPANDEIAYINTFNYTEIDKATSGTIWHINGDCEHPIFGVDFPRVSSVGDDCYRYTKTYRRLELEGKQQYSPTNKKYRKVVVCGHSLNEQDYSYYYALFNHLNLSNDRGQENAHKVVFTYYRYNEMAAEEVRRQTIERVLKLFQNYNADILQAPHFRLMDILFCAGAVEFKEIPVKDLLAKK